MTEGERNRNETHRVRSGRHGSAWRLLRVRVRRNPGNAGRLDLGRRAHGHHRRRAGGLLSAPAALVQPSRADFSGDALRRARRVALQTDGRRILCDRLPQHFRRPVHSPAETCRDASYLRFDPLRRIRDWRPAQTRLRWVQGHRILSGHDVRCRPDWTALRQRHTARSGAERPAERRRRRPGRGGIGPGTPVSRPGHSGRSVAYDHRQPHHGGPEPAHDHFSGHPAGGLARRAGCARPARPGRLPGARQGANPAGDVGHAACPHRRVHVDEQGHCRAGGGLHSLACLVLPDRGDRPRTAFRVSRGHCAAGGRARVAGAVSTRFRAGHRTVIQHLVELGDPPGDD